MFVSAVYCKNEDDFVAEFGYRDYVSYIPGSDDSPLVLTAAHGGGILPDDITVRGRGCWNITHKNCTYIHQCEGIGKQVRTRCLVSGVTEIYTIELAVDLRRWIGLQMGIYPHLIVNHLQRSWFDPDLPEDQATFMDEEAIRAYNDYHGYIDKVTEPEIRHEIFLITEYVYLLLFKDLCEICILSTSSG